jgi:hypothetical protein
MRSTMTGIRSNELEPSADGSTEDEACVDVVVSVSAALEPSSP